MTVDNNIYILNFWWAANYGANLTAFALNKLIKNSVLLDNSEKNQLIKEGQFTYHKNFQKKYLKTEKFNLKNILDKKNSTFVVGSDQVFRPCLNKNISDTFFLDYVSAESRKISISASFGVDKEKFLKENTNDDIEQMKKSLQTFDFVSVREKSGVEICKDIFGIDAILIIDPVFILDKRYYENMINNFKTNKNYKIVSHTFDPKNRIKKYSDKKVFEMAGSNISIEEWLYRIKNSDLLLTDSYHAMCYAIIFNKPFVCTISAATGSTRYDSLFELLGIKNQCIKSIDDINHKDCVFDIDYEAVNKKIEEQRGIGQKLIHEALSIPCECYEEKKEAQIKYMKRKICELENKANIDCQIKQELWCIWLYIWCRIIPNIIKQFINLFRGMVKK